MNECMSDQLSPPLQASSPKFRHPFHLGTMPRVFLSDVWVCVAAPVSTPTDPSFSSRPTPPSSLSLKAALSLGSIYSGNDDLLHH